MLSTLPIQCRCGSLRGTLTNPASALRLVCYCRDCQTYARALGKGVDILDSNGGTNIVASLQQQVSFSHGRDKLACMSLTDTGIYRWYAGCCNTPIANTTRRPQMSYVGLVHACLASSPARVSDIWPAHFTVNTANANGSVPSPGIKALMATLSIAKRVIGARIAGTWRGTPFFAQGTSRPVVEPRVLSGAELQSARSAV
ncbi:MAG: hypothetical protein KIT63_02815 [Rhodoferax sp.]|nr:hypothetical protein [Rhodoferax sp.]